MSFAFRFQGSFRFIGKGSVDGRKEGVVRRKGRRGCLCQQRLHRAVRRERGRFTYEDVRSSGQIVRGRGAKDDRRNLYRLRFTWFPAKGGSGLLVRGELSARGIRWFIFRLLILSLTRRFTSVKDLVLIVNVPALLVMMVNINDSVNVAGDSMFCVVVGNLDDEEEGVVLRHSFARQVFASRHVCGGTFAAAIQSCGNCVFIYPSDYHSKFNWARGQITYCTPHRTRYVLTRVLLFLSVCAWSIRANQRRLLPIQFTSRIHRRLSRHPCVLPCVYQRMLPSIQR